MASSLPQNSPTVSKAASNRLLTMKFMQKPFNTPIKYQYNKHSSSSTPSQTPTSDRRQAEKTHLANILAEEESKREAALMTTVAKEERWQFSFASDKTPRKQGELVGGVRVVTENDDDDDDERRSSSDEEATAGRTMGKRYFGGRRKVEAKKEESSGSESVSDSGSDIDADEALRRRQTKQEEKERKERKANDSLKGLQSISNPGPAGGGSAAFLKNVTCFECGQAGHMKTDCPQITKSGGGVGKKRKSDGVFDAGRDKRRR